MKRLINNGMDAVEYNDKYLHAKLYSIDNKIYTTGYFELNNQFIKIRFIQQ